MQQIGASSERSDGDVFTLTRLTRLASAHEGGTTGIGKHQRIIANPLANISNVQNRNTFKKESFFLFRSEDSLAWLREHALLLSSSLGSLSSVTMQSNKNNEQWK